MITAHFLFEWLAYFSAFAYYRFSARKVSDPLEANQRIWIIIAAAIGALIGSRALDILEHINLFETTHNTWLYIISSKTIVGAILGGLISVEIAKKILKIKRSTGDAFVYPLMLGMMIGRIGCFLDGLHDGTIGVATSLPWGYDFGDGVRRHPTSIYEIIFLILLWGFLKSIQRRKQLANGQLFRLFLVFYLSYRFLVAFIEPIYPLVLGLSAIQLASLIGVLCYGRVMFQVFLKRKENSGNT